MAKRIAKTVVVCVFVWGKIDHVSIANRDQSESVRGELGGFMRTVYVDGVAADGSRMSESEDMGQVQRAALMAQRVKQKQPAWSW